MKVVARSSNLSKKQVEEVQTLLKQQGVSVQLHPIYLLSKGDKDQNTSLKTMSKNDFFTKEIDEHVIAGKSDIALHSAKDLPKKLPKELEIIAITHGQCSKDVLVMKEGKTLETLATGSRIGSSSFRRDEIIMGLRPDFVPVDIRGTIEKRLELLANGKLEGVVIAKAALIRLGLLHLNRIDLPGKTTPYQGQLAVVARKDHPSAKKLFSSLDSRPTLNKVLYFGLEPTNSFFYTHHHPLIQTQPAPLPKLENSPLKELEDYTHLIFTSKQGVKHFFNALQEYKISIDRLAGKQWLAVGASTCKALEDKGVKGIKIPKTATQEGLVSLLAVMDLTGAYLLLVTAREIRSHLPNFLAVQGTRFKRFVVYETKAVASLKQEGLEGFDRYIFTAPSTVRAFARLSAWWPPKEKIEAIGPVTEAQLNFYL